MNTLKLVIWPIAKILFWPLFAIAFLISGIFRGLGKIGEYVEGFADEWRQEINAAFNPKFYQLYKDAVQEAKIWKPRFEAANELYNHASQELQGFKDKYEPNPNLNGYKNIEFEQTNTESPRVPPGCIGFIE